MSVLLARDFGFSVFFGVDTVWVMPRQMSVDLWGVIFSLGLVVDG